MGVYLEGCLAFGIKLPVSDSFPMERFDGIDSVEVCRYCQNKYMLIVPGSEMVLSKYNLMEGGLPNVVDLPGLIFSVTQEKVDLFISYCRGAGMIASPKWHFFLRYD